MREEQNGIGLMTRRVINKIGRPFGINPFARAFPNPLSQGPVSRQAVFDRIFAANYWGSQQSHSGLGSEKAFTQIYCRELQELIRTQHFSSMFDAPCGDLNWMPEVVMATGISYVGGDISTSVVERARQCHPGFEIKNFDICEDPFPTVDVWHCRDCLFHLSFGDIRNALSNYLSSRIPYVLLTTHKARWHRNLDVTTGGFRYLDLERHPINLPPATRYLRDYKFGVDFPRYVGLWPREAVEKALAAWI